MKRQGMKQRMLNVLPECKKIQILLLQRAQTVSTVKCHSKQNNEEYDRLLLLTISVHAAPFPATFV